MFQLGIITDEVSQNLNEVASFCRDFDLWGWTFGGGGGTIRKTHQKRGSQNETAFVRRSCAYGVYRAVL